MWNALDVCKLIGASQWWSWSPNSPHHAASMPHKLLKPDSESLLVLWQAKSPVITDHVTRFIPRAYFWHRPLLANTTHFSVALSLIEAGPLQAATCKPLLGNPRNFILPLPALFAQDISRSADTVHWQSPLPTASGAFVLSPWFHMGMPIVLYPT